MRKTATIITVLVGMCIFSSGCDQIAGGGQAEAPPAAPYAVPPAQPVPPGTPQAIPGQPVAATIPGQPTAVPGQPVAAVPGQPAAVPMVPGQPVATPVTAPGQPVAAPVPGQPVAAPAPVAPPTPTGDALTDKLNAKKYEVAAAFTPTSALLKQALEKNKPQSYQVQLPGPPYCQTFIAVADDKVSNIDLSLESPTGTQEAADDQKESSAVIANHCPTVPGAYKLTVSIPKDSGEFAIQVFSK
jgi:hypothetical protein